MIGPSHYVTVPTMVEEADGTETDTGLETNLVDFSLDVLPFMRELSAWTVCHSLRPCLRPASSGCRWLRRLGFSFTRPTRQQRWSLLCRSQ